MANVRKKIRRMNMGNYNSLVKASQVMTNCGVLKSDTNDDDLIRYLYGKKKMRDYHNFVIAISRRISNLSEKEATKVINYILSADKEEVNNYLKSFEDNYFIANRINIENMTEKQKKEQEIYHYYVRAGNFLTDCRVISRSYAVRQICDYDLIEFVRFPLWMPPNYNCSFIELSLEEGAKAMSDFIINLSDKQIKKISNNVTKTSDYSKVYRFDVVCNALKDNENLLSKLKMIKVERIEKSIIELTQHPAYPLQRDIHDIEVELNELKKILTNTNDEKYNNIIDKYHEKLKMIKVFQ